MDILHIDSPSDPRLNDYRSLTDTALRTIAEPAGGLYIAESAKVIERAIGAGHVPRSVLVQARRLEGIAALVGSFDIPVYVVPDDVAEAVTGFAVHRGAIASMRRPVLPSVIDALGTLHPQASGATRSRIAVLEGLADHTNIGALFRSAAALGVDAILISPDCSDPLYRRAVRVSMGTVFQVPWTRIPEWPAGIHELQDAGFVVAGMTLGAGAISLDALVAEDHEKLALVFGTEGHGITAATDAILDRRVTIPMRGGVDSLNVAAASAVAFYATR